MSLLSWTRVPTVPVACDAPCPCCPGPVSPLSRWPVILRVLLPWWSVMPHVPVPHVPSVPVACDTPCPCCPGALCPRCPRALCPADRCFADCSGQDEQFSLVFTIGSFMNNFMTFPMGYIFDRFGTTVARLIAISLYTTGTLLVAFSTPVSAVLLFPAMSLLSVGGILLILTNMQVLYERGLSLRAMFLFMAGCSAWHLLRTLFLMPRRRIPYPLPPAYDYGLRCERRSRSYRTYEEKRPPGDGGPEDAPLEPGPEPPAPRGPKGDPDGASFGACVCSGLFAWHVVWLSAMQLRHYLFIGTLNPLLDHLAHGDADLVSAYTNAFAFAQLCGVLCAPWNGLILDRHKRGKAPRAHGAQPLLPLRGQRRLPGHRVPPAALREALRAGHGPVGAGGPAAVPLLRPGAGAAPGEPLLRECPAPRWDGGGAPRRDGGGTPWWGGGGASRWDGSGVPPWEGWCPMVGWGWCPIAGWGWCPAMGGVVPRGGMGVVSHHGRDGAQWWDGGAAQWWEGGCPMMGWGWCPMVGWGWCPRVGEILPHGGMEVVPHGGRGAAP
uniref:Solute carrier family 43 member 3 n=1 Tax=Apteryx owenii TaxID=8824 RepID=A0A8B9PBH2_APTOW